MALQHLRSGTANKRPIPTVMSAGQIAINTNETSPGLFFKDSNGDLVKVGPVHIGTTAPNSSPDSVAATALVTGTVYQILTVGTSDFTLVGASANTVGTIFTATGTTTGDGTVSGQQGVEKGEMWLDTTSGSYILKVYDGAAWRSQEFSGDFGSQDISTTGDISAGGNITSDTLQVDGTSSRIGGTSSSIGQSLSVEYSADHENIIAVTGADVTSEYLGLGITSGAAMISAGGVNATSTDLVFRTANAGTQANRVWFKADGKAGIGTSSPGTKLEVSDTAALAYPLSATGDTTATNPQHFQIHVNETSGYARLGLDGGGIGTLGGSDDHYLISYGANHTDNGDLALKNNNSSGKLAFYTAYGEVAYMSSSGVTRFNTTVECRGALDLADNNTLRFGSSDDVRIQYDTNNWLYVDFVTGNGIIFRDNGTDNIRLEDSGIFRPTTDGSCSIGTTDVRWANGYFDELAVTGNLYVRGNLDLLDNDKLLIGSSDDMQLYHNGTNSYIDNNKAHLYIRNNVNDDDGGNIYIQAKSGENSIVCNDDSSVVLYNNGTACLSTSSAEVTGSVAIYADLIPTSDNQGNVGTSGRTWANGRFTSLTIDSTLSVRGAIDLADGDVLRMGSSDDWTVTYNSNGWNYINQKQNGIIFQDNGTARMRLEDNGIFRPETTNTGTIGSSSYYWSNGYFQSFNVSGTLAVRGAIDLADNDILRLGSGDDAEFFVNGSHLYLDLNSGIGNFYIRDGSTTRFTFNDNGSFTATSGITAGGTATFNGSTSFNSSSNVFAQGAWAKFGSFSNTFPGVANTNVGGLIENSSSGASGFFSRSSATGLFLNRNNDGTLQELKRSGTTRGTIAINSNVCSFNNLSDYRTKENISTMAGSAERLLAIQPRTFNFIEFPEKQVEGFVAHELQEVVPMAVTGEKDAIDDNGDPVYQMVDQSKLIPLLTSALQEAINKINDLEARLTAAGL